MVEYKKGQLIYCGSGMKAVKMMQELGKQGIETDFFYAHDEKGNKEVWLEVIHIEAADE